MLRRKISERTVNVTVLPDIRRAVNGGEFLELGIPRDGRRVHYDAAIFCALLTKASRLFGDDVMRLASERSPCRGNPNLAACATKPAR